jgi:dihydrodipicolinate synthase/N-acetylneuraminate lyase
MTEKIRGIVLPLSTVFLEDGRVDEDLMRELTEFYIRAGVHSLFILGSYYTEALSLRGFRVKMYPRWPSPPLTKEAQQELEELFARLGVTAAPSRAKSA